MRKALTGWKSPIVINQRTTQTPTQPKIHSTKDPLEIWDEVTTRLDNGRSITIIRRADCYRVVALNHQARPIRTSQNSDSEDVTRDLARLWTRELYEGGDLMVENKRSGIVYKYTVKIHGRKTA